MALVLGLGNEIVGDDAVGILVARAVREAVDGVEVIESAASGLGLLEVLADHDRVVVVDSVVTGLRPPGSVVEMPLSDVGRVLAPSVHQTGLPELAAVARRLGLGFPSETVVVAIEVEDPYTIGGPLSDAVAAAVPRAVELVVDRLRGWEDRDRSEVDPCTTTTPSRS
jgi:hydrogenase maturation protease